MKYISLFSGIEAASVAWSKLGWEPLAFSEIEPYCCAVLAHHYPNVPNLGDITKIDWSEAIERVGRPDVIISGSPCQSFSIAGGRASLAGESRLMFEHIRAIREVRPRWMLWENVPGVLNTRDNAFAQLLDEIQKCGYSLAWRTLDSQFIRVPDRDVQGRIRGWHGPVAQRRRRVFLIGHLGEDGSAAAVLFEPESMSGNTQSSREKREELARATKDNAREGSSDTIAFDDTQITSPQNGSNPQVNDPAHPLAANQHPPAIVISTANTGANGSNINEDEVSYTLDRTNSNAVCIQGNMIGRSDDAGPAGAGINDNVAFTLNTTDRHAVMCMSSDTSNAAIDEDMTGTLHVGGGSVNSNGEDLVGALCARDYKGIGNQYVSEGKVICMRVEPDE